MTPQGSSLLSEARPRLWYLRVGYLDICLLHNVFMFVQVVAWCIEVCQHDLLTFRLAHGVRLPPTGACGTIVTWCRRGRVRDRAAPM